MELIDQQIYQGPGRPGITLRSGDSVEGCTFQHVGFSLLRMFTGFEWHPFIEVPPEAEDVQVIGCTFRLRPAGVQLEIGRMASAR